MLHVIIILLSFYALTFTIKESVLFDRPRSFLIRLHPLAYHLFSCYFCVGFWASLMIYFIANAHFNWREMILWGFGGAAFSYITNLIVDRISANVP